MVFLIYHHLIYGTRTSLISDVNYFFSFENKFLRINDILYGKSWKKFPGHSLVAPMNIHIINMCSCRRRIRILSVRPGQDSFDIRSLEK